MAGGRVCGGGTADRSGHAGEGARVMVAAGWCVGAGRYPFWGVHRQTAPERLQTASSPGR